MTRRFTLTATETTIYQRTVTLEELEAEAKVTLAECGGDLDLLLDTVRDQHSDEFQEWLERHGNVDGQVWEFDELPVEPEPVVSKQVGQSAPTSTVPTPRAIADIITRKGLAELAGRWQR